MSRSSAGAWYHNPGKWCGTDGLREQGAEVSTYHLPSALLERLRCRQRVRPNVRHKMVPGDLEKAGAGM